MSALAQLRERAESFGRDATKLFELGGVDNRRDAVWCRTIADSLAEAADMLEAELANEAVIA